jgi:hypothetical protein
MTEDEAQGWVLLQRLAVQRAAPEPVTIPHTFVTQSQKKTLDDLRIC